MRRLTDSYVRVLLNVYIDRMYLATQCLLYTHVAHDEHYANDADDVDDAIDAHVCIGR